jgi:hypothetical protein
MIGRKNEPRQPLNKTKLILGGIVLIAVLIGGFALYVLAALNWSYSDGERSGVLQKFSRKGWVCKTFEGELAMSYLPGMAPVVWNFTVRDEAVAIKLNDGLGKKVVLHYTEHHGLPSDCFGETQYFVDNLRAVE